MYLKKGLDGHEKGCIIPGQEMLDTERDSFSSKARNAVDLLSSNARRPPGDMTSQTRDRLQHS